MYKLRKKHKRVLTIVAISILLLGSISLFITTYLGQAALVANSLINGEEFLFPDNEYQDKPEYIGDTNVENGYMSAYHMKASKIDVTKINEMISSGVSINVPEEYWNLSMGGVRDYAGEILLYNLICEILTREEINPKSSDYIIKPEYVYGSWFNECGFTRGSKDSFDPYTQPVINSTPLYWGPLSLHKDYFKQEQGSPYDLRMYVYIPVLESPEMSTNERVMRIRNYELYNTAPDCSTIIGSDYNQIAGLSKYGDTIKRNIKFDGKTSNTNVQSASARPSPEVASDAVYTFCRKLRTAYLCKDIYTLNTNYATSMNNLNKIYNKEIQNKTSDKYSDLCFLYGLQLNSGKIKMHQWGETLTPQRDTTGTMPYIYIQMLKKYGTLNLTNIAGLKGWKDNSHLDSMVTGKEKGKTYLTETPITNENNIITSIGARDIFDTAIARLRTQEPRFYEEYSWTSSYGLECIANGTMITRGVESAIDQIYSWQASKGYLKGESSDSVNLAISSNVTERYFGPEVKSMDVCLPWIYDVPVTRHITHNFYCSEYGATCRYHSQLTHHGIDMTYTNMSTGTPVQVTIRSIMKGKIVRVSNTKFKDSYNRFYGNSVFIEHEIGNQKFLTIYAHMKDGMIFTPENVGTPVEAGTILGIEGTTGNSTGNHLHFGIKNLNTGVFYDPEPLLCSLKFDYERGLKYLDTYSAISPKVKMSTVPNSKLQAKLRGLE